MNKIYKVVWNKARNCYVVASEFAKNHQTGSSRIKAASVAAVMAATMLTIGTGVIYAADVTDTTRKLVKETILFDNEQDANTKLNDPNLKHDNPDSWVHGHTAQCGELTYNTTLTIGDINQVADALVANDKSLYNQGIQKVTMQNGRISLIRNDNSRVKDSIALTGNDGKNGKDIAVTVTVGNESQTFQTGSVVTAKTDTSGKATGLTINGKSYDIKAGKTYKAGENVTIADDGTISATDTTYSAGDNVTIDKNTISVDLSEYAKSDDVAVVYNEDKTSLKSTNSGIVGKNAIALGNGAITGAKSTSIGDNAIGGREGTITIGANANNGALYATIVGTDSSINYGSRYSGAVSTVIGSKNNIKNDEQKYSGVASSILGTANTIENSNGVTIQGTGNTVTGAYKNMNLSFLDGLKLLGGDSSVLKEKESGAIAIIGGANTISNQTSSTVIGFGNTLKGKNSTGVFTAGSHNTLTNVFNSLVMGDNNTLKNRKNVISLGNNNTVDADDAVAIGNGTTVKAESGVAIGVGSVADRVADSEKGKRGYFAPDTIPTGQESTWTSTKGAVSVGNLANNITRQITNVAAGNEDTDAVNVAQLKQVASQAERANQGWNLTTNGVAAAATNVAPGGSVDFSGDDNVSVSNKETKVKVALNKDVQLNSAIFGDTVINANGLTIGNGTSGLEFSKNRVSVGGQQIHDVADGKDDMDAVNMSQLNKQTAASKTTVSDGTNTTVTSTVAADGHTDYKVNLNKDVQLNSATFGDTVINANGLTIGNGTAGLEFSKNRVSVGGQQIHDVANGIDDMDAVNVSQLNKATASSKTTVSDGTNTTVTSTVAADGHTDYKVNLNKDLTGIESMTNGLSSIRMGNGGTVTINNVVTIDQTGKISGVADGAVKEGSNDAVNGSQLKGVENKVDKNTNDIADNKKAIQKNTEKIVKNAENIQKNTESISKNAENIQKNTEAIAKNAENIQKNTEAIAKNTENITKNTEAIGKLDERVTSVEEVAKKHTTVSTDDENVQISEDTNKDGGKNYKVSLNKDLKLDSVKVGENVSLTKDGLTAGDTKVTNAGLSIGDKTYVSTAGLNANNQTITNVANGKVEKGSTDAVNGGQLYETNQAIANNATNISSLSHSISNLDNRVNKVGAGAAALAALHPLDFDPDAKWDFAAGYGNYRGANAAAVGAYYRPNEDTMFSVGGTFGNGENMVNAGVSFKLGSGSSHVSTSRVAMAKEIKELRGELEAMKSAMLDANAGKKIDTSKLQLFPDVPQNHWAYEYVTQLAGNGMIEGYPDGNFAGDRPMTRYEFAAILYRAMTKGAVLSDKILNEFSHELEYFTVDTVAKDKAGNPTIQRVRTVKENKNK